MPKMSKATASSHLELPGYVDEYEQQVGDWTVTLEKTLVDIDLAPLFKGGPDDMCPASHMGYVVKGKFGVRNADGTEEIYEAGEAYVLEPGHTPIHFAGSEYVAFTPAQEARQQVAVMMPNMVKWAEEQGIELPEQLTSSQ